MNNYFYYRDFDAYSLKFREDAIMHLHFKIAEKITIIKYKEIVEEIGIVLNHKKVPFLISAAPFEVISNDIRSLVATEEGAPYSLADAIISDSVGVNILANFYIRIVKPTRPTKLFNKETEAIDWLKKFL